MLKQTGMIQEALYRISLEEKVVDRKTLTGLGQEDAERTWKNPKKTFGRT